LWRRAQPTRWDARARCPFEADSRDRIRRIAADRPSCCDVSLQSLYTSFPNLVSIDGVPTSLAQFKGNVSLVINVATY
jgi:hypothetical protein